MRTCILGADVVLFLSGVTFVLFVSFSYFLLLLKTQSFVQSFFVLRYSCAQTVTRSYHCLRPFYFIFFLSLGILLFPSIFVPLLVPFLFVMESVCVCFLPIHSGHQVRWTYQPGSHRRKVTQDFSSTFFLWCVP